MCAIDSRHRSTLGARLSAEVDIAQCVLVFNGGSSIKAPLLSLPTVWEKEPLSHAKTSEKTMYTHRVLRENSQVLSIRTSW